MELPDASEIDTRRAHSALSLLCDGAWWTVTDLVRATAAPRRSVEALLAHVGAQRDGTRFRLTPEQLDSTRALLANGSRPFTAADPVTHLLADHAGVVERLTELIAKAPRAQQALDHVTATPDTVVRRALLLGARFWLPSGRLLCVGDHDLTSLAIAMIYPDAQVTVVDLDERILAYIDERAGELGLDVRTLWADLRLGLPHAAREHADLAITDPPYTPEGIGLFAARAVEGLRDPARGRVLLAYGASDRTPALALKVQHALHELNLVFEAIHPDFNRYFGAEAIGSAADLYVLRPTSKTLPAVADEVAKTGTAIYTHGPQSVESSSSHDVPADALEDLQPDVLVGGWPRDVLPKTPRAQLSTWLDRPYAARTRHVAIALPAGLRPALVRVLLASRAERVRVFTGKPAGGADPDAELDVLAPVYELTVRHDVVDAVRRPADDGDVLRRIMDRAHGKLVNTWRDALITVHGAHGTLTKKQSRTVVLDAAPWADGVTLLELPLHRLRELPRAVRASIEAAAKVSSGP